MPKYNSYLNSDLGLLIKLKISVLKDVIKGLVKDVHNKNQYVLTFPNWRQNEILKLINKIKYHWRTSCVPPKNVVKP